MADNGSFILTVMNHHTEFISGTPGTEKMFRGHRFHNIGKILDIPVSPIVAVRIVYGFKVIQIKHNRCAYLLGRHFLQHLFRQKFKMFKFI